jgi:hypothetical protein
LRGDTYTKCLPVVANDTSTPTEASFGFSAEARTFPAPSLTVITAPSDAGQLPRRSKKVV